MNYYFLLEDERSLISVLPTWLQYMDFPAQRVLDIKSVSSNNYVMQSGQGVTQLITRVLFQTLDTIYENKGVIDYLVIIVDAEELDAADRKLDIQNKIQEYEKNKGQKLCVSYKIFVCNHCFESWLLGNRQLYPLEQPFKNEDFYEYYMHYNIAVNDPERMSVPTDNNETIAKYHFHYLHEACRYNKIRYSKKKPDNVAKKEYFQEIQKRILESNDLMSFKEFYDFICLMK